VPPKRTLLFKAARVADSRSDSHLTTAAARREPPRPPFVAPNDDGGADGAPVLTAVSPRRETVAIAGGAVRLGATRSEAAALGFVWDNEVIAVLLNFNIMRWNVM